MSIAEHGSGAAKTATPDVFKALGHVQQKNLLILDIVADSTEKGVRKKKRAKADVVPEEAMHWDGKCSRELPLHVISR